MRRSWWRRLAATAAVVALAAVTVWLLTKGTRGAEVANVLALPLTGLSLIVTAVASRAGSSARHGGRPTAIPSRRPS